MSTHVNTSIREDANHYKPSGSIANQIEKLHEILTLRASTMLEKYIRAEAIIHSALKRCVNEEIGTLQPSFLPTLTATLLYGFIQREGASDSRLSTSDVLENMRRILSTGKLSATDMDGILSRLAELGIVTEKGGKYRLNRSLSAEALGPLPVIMTTLSHIDAELRDFVTSQGNLAAQVREAEYQERKTSSNVDITIDSSEEDKATQREFSTVSDLEGEPQTSPSTRDTVEMNTLSPVTDEPVADVTQVVEESLNRSLHGEPEQSSKSIQDCILLIGTLGRRLVSFLTRIDTEYPDAMQAFDDLALVKDAKQCLTAQKIVGTGKASLKTMAERVYNSEREILKDVTQREMEVYLRASPSHTLSFSKMTNKEMKKKSELCRNASHHWVRSATKRAFDYSADIYRVSHAFNQLGVILEVIEALGVSESREIQNSYDDLQREVPCLQQNWWGNSIELGKWISLQTEAA